MEEKRIKKSFVLMFCIIGFMLMTGGIVSADYLSINLGGTNSTLVSDTTPPTISTIYPINTTYNFKQILFNIITDEKSNCTYSLNNFVTNSSLLTDLNGLTHFNSQTLSNGNYTVKYSCSDIYNNLNNTVSTSFTIDYSAPSTYVGSNYKEMSDKLTELESKLNKTISTSTETSQVKVENKDLTKWIILGFGLLLFIIIAIVLDLMRRKHKITLAFGIGLMLLMILIILVGVYLFFLKDILFK